MNLRKDFLEKGVVITPEGKVKEYQRGYELQQGELLVIFSESGLKSEILIDGERNLIHKNGIIVTQAPKQAMMQSILMHFYSMCCLETRTGPAGGE